MTRLAGGIGITPIRSMMRRLEALGRSYELHYACRTRREMAFCDMLSTRSTVRLHVDAEASCFLDVAEICRSAPANAHLYCCGPGPMLATFEAATTDRSEDHVHVEYFSSREQAAIRGGFKVELAHSGMTLTVEPGQRIIDVLRATDVEVLVSSEQGVCGSCETRVIAGEPDHRCEVLSETERRENRTMMVCCGGSKSSRLVLDIWRRRDGH